ncbi:coiled-coil domain-containing protein 175 [Meriones unguiculatus]|uniref:coiled-coil domain-containing protein 175 n=1 Tax=Meriones unguiculatus TaxID=10047 RepID=UPI000B4EDE32|nr:coiled-coil domain-containing protein 175 [Meriones unguiculatus]
MARRSWTPDRGFVSQTVMRPAAVSTNLSLELCTCPPTLGSSVAVTALEQLLVVEKSLQGDYFKCNEEVKTFLKNTITAVKKLEEMRKNTIELLEIESMELSKLYFLLDSVPNSINREMEECITDARRLNLSEIKQMKSKIEKMDNEAVSLKTRIIELKEKNEALGVKQAELAEKHAEYVLSLNQTMEEKATATIDINNTYTKINIEKEETEHQKRSLQETNELVVKHQTEYNEMKELLTAQLKELKEFCDTRRKDTYTKKKRLNRLQNKMIRMKRTVTSSTMILSDHGIEMTRLQESIESWTAKVEEIKKVCGTLEEKLKFFQGNQVDLDSDSFTTKSGFLTDIHQIGGKMHKLHMENKRLRESQQGLLRQYELVLKDETTTNLQRQKIYNETQKQLQLIYQKEAFLRQRKLDIKSMYEGFEALQELQQSTKEVYQKQIKILIENLIREIQRSAVFQWKILCANNRHAAWLAKMKSFLRRTVKQIEIAERKRVELIHEAKHTEEEIYEFVGQIENVKLELKEEEKMFVKKERKLIQQLHKFEDLIIKEAQIAKEREEQLVESIPQLETAENEYVEKNRELKAIHSNLTAKKQEENLINTYISRFRKDILKSMANTEKLKQELKYLRDVESQKTKEHFEVFRNLENEIYVNDQKEILLMLENKKLKEFIAYLKKKVEEFKEKQRITVKDSGDLAWQLTAQHKHYSDLVAAFQTMTKDLTSSGEETLQEIKTVIERLYYRDERTETMSSWLLGGISRLRLLMEESPVLNLVEKLGKGFLPPYSS